MARTARLDNVTHADLRVASGFGAAYGDAVNQMPLFLPEFAAAQRDYPILFQRQADGLLQAQAILGFDRDENLFLDGARWSARHIPAWARRGPFLIGLTGDEPLLHVDLDHPRIVAADSADSLPVFLPHGGHARALEWAMQALREIHVGREVMQAATPIFDELGLVQPVALEVSVTDSDVVRFEDFLAIEPARIDALSGDALARLNGAGLLQPAVLAAASLGNFGALAARKRALLG